MASFVDKLIPFTPYEQQLPVESMVRVGLEKQKEYEKGVQRIQSSIDNVAGLDIVRPVDQSYLQARLDVLGNNLKGVAAADFSNSQLTNSVAGMASQIGKDANIQNAVSASMKYKKEAAEMEKAKSEGKSSPENIAWFGRGANAWMNDTKVGAGFNEEYIPYVDVQKKWMEVQKNLGITDTTTDIPFYQDSEGRYTDAQGKVLPAGSKPVPNDVMIEKISKGHSPQAIKDAIMASMDENDIKQLGITGWYHYKDYTPEDLSKVAMVTHNEHLQTLYNQLDSYKTQKSIEPKNIQYQNMMDRKISDIEADIASSTDGFTKTLSLIGKNPDEFRSRLYTQNAINQFATNFSDLNESIKIVNSPYIEKAQKDRTYALAVDNYRLNFWKAHQEDARAAERLAFDKQKEGLGAGVIQPGMLTQNISTNVNPATITTFLADIDSRKAELVAAKQLFRSTQMGKTISDGEFEKQYAFHLQQYNDGREVEQKWKNLFDNVISAEEVVNNNSAIIHNIEVEAYHKFGKEDIKGKVEWINQQLAQKTVNYQARSGGFNAKQTPYVSGQFAQFVKRIETDKGGKQETNPMTKDWNVDIAKALIVNPNTKYGFTIQGNDVYLTMQGDIKDKPVPTQVIKTNSNEFYQMFGQSAISPIQGTEDLIFQNGNTNPQSGSSYSTITENPNAYKTAHFIKRRGESSLDSFPNVVNYNVKADITDNGNGQRQAIFYIQDSKTGKWIVRQGPPSPNTDTLVTLFHTMDDNTLAKYL